MTDTLPTPRTDRPELLSALRSDLDGVGYAVDQVQELLGPLASAALHREQPLAALRVLEEAQEARHEDPDRARRATLVRCFVLGRPVPATDLDLALPSTGVEGLLQLRLVARVEGDGAPGAAVRATCDLRPYGTEQQTWWVASDLSELATGGPLPTDHVLGVGGASTTLASWTPRPRVERALDVGTGCGVQALHLSAHTVQRTVTDLSARALEMARFTLALNGVDAVVRQGSLLQPVAGELFDLVVTNPPFVITPRRPDVPRYDYRDGGQAGDALVAGLVREIAGHLRPGGLAQLLANWELGEGEDWRARLTGWLAGTGLDAWVVQREVQDVGEYAETWARDGGHRPGTAQFEALYAAWLDDFASRAVESVGFGVITLQRPTTDREPWLDLVDVPHAVAAPMGPTVLQGIRTRTWLAEHDDDDLVEVAWRVADDVTEERIGRPGEPDPQVIQLRQGGGLRRTVRLDTLGAGLVGALDGELTARQLCAGLAVLTETPPAEVERAVLPLLRDLVADGLLV